MSRTEWQWERFYGRGNYDVEFSQIPGVGNVGIRERAKKDARGGRTCISKGMEVTKFKMC